MTLLVDLGGLSCCAVDDGLEGMFKAMAETPGGDDRVLWDPHENPYLTHHVEAVTRLFQGQLTAMQDELARALTGHGMPELKKADAPWMRWDEAAFDAARERLETKPPELWTLDDWLLMCDVIMQRHLPDGVLRAHADYLTVRATLAGKIMAAMAGRTVSANEAGAVVDLVETSFRQVPPKVLTPVEAQTLRISQARAAENISDVARQAQHRMKGIVIRHVQGQVLGQSDAQALRQELFDNFGQLNRDFRRIAISEAGECCNQGFIAAQGKGQKVKRMEAYRGACPFCRSINGKVFEVVPAAQPQKDGETQVWEGKTNIGRSASPRRREGNALVERLPSERWWPAAGIQHPNCRGSWTPVSPDPPPGMNPEFHGWLKGKIAAAFPPPPPPGKRG